MALNFAGAYGAPTASAGALDPILQDSLLRTLARPVAGGLSVVGNILDTPGAFVRTTLAGENPFPGIFDPSRRVSGRDLLDHWGMVEPNRRGSLDTGDVLGFAAEVLTDPLTYLTFGGSALSRSGQVAKAAGQLDDLSRVGRMTSTLGDLAGATDDAGRAALSHAAEGAGTTLSSLLASGDKLGGLVGVGLPFSQPSIAAGTGPLAQSIAGGMDTLGAKLSASTPGRLAAALFDPTVQGTVTPEAQTMARELTSAQDAGRRAALEQGFGVLQSLDRAGLPEDQLTTMLDAAVERSSGNRWADELTGQLAGLEAPQRQAFTGAVDQMVEHKDALYRQMQDVGLHAPELLDEQVAHFPRYLSQDFKAVGGDRKLLNTSFESALARSDIFRNVPGGRAAINAMGSDPALLGPERLSLAEAAAHVGDAYGIADPDQAKGIARWLARRPDEALGSPVYGSPVRDYLSYQLRGNEAVAAAQTVQDFLAQHAAPLAESPDTLVKLTDVLHRARFVDPETGQTSLRALERIGAKLGKTVPETAALGVPADIAGDVGRLMQGFTSPDATKPLVSAFDSFLNLWKAGVTTPFPGFHVRNRMAGLWQNFVLGAFDPKVESQVDGLVRYGKPIEGLEGVPVIRDMLRADGLTPSAASATEELQKLAFTHELTGRHQSPGTDAVGALLEHFTGAIPGRAPIERSLLGQVGKSISDWFPRDLESANPLNVRGVMGREETRFAPVKAGQDLGHYIEQMNRLSPFVSLLKQGVDPTEAAARVKAAQVDYAARNFTDFERNVMTRLAPFYKFTSRMLPFQLRELIERPGGAAGQAVRASSIGREDDPLAPPHVTRGLAIGAGRLDDGTQRYITGFGLPHEDPLSLLQVGPGLMRTAGATGMELLGRLNPLAKGAIEVATGRQLWAQGRDLQDADPTLGRLISNVRQTVTGEPSEPVRLPLSIEYALSAAPFTGRTLSTARQLFDPRKGPLEKTLGATTGVKITDVSPAAQEAQLRDMLQTILRDDAGGKVFSKVVVPKESLQSLSPGERLRALQAKAVLDALSRNKITLDQLGY